MKFLATPLVSNIGRKRRMNMANDRRLYLVSSRVDTFSWTRFDDAISTTLNTNGVRRVSDVLVVEFNRQHVVA